jgi:hypothetical protein
VPGYPIRCSVESGRVDGTGSDGMPADFASPDQASSVSNDRDGAGGDVFKNDTNRRSRTRGAFGPVRRCPSTFALNVSE